jgi:hypothetical protein
MDQPAYHSTASDLAGHPSPNSWNEFSSWLTRWLLFFLISLGLGYAAVQRYDPRATPGLSDAAVYYRLVAGEEVLAREMRFRVLVPSVAKLVYKLTARFLDNPRAVFLALLISNSIFCATTACLLVAVGIRVSGSLATTLLGATLYLLNFAVMHLQLAGMVDAGEACLILAVVVTLFGRRWWLLPLWGVVGALAKETFLPLAGVLPLVWWYVEYRRSHDNLRKLFPIVAMIVTAAATILILRSMIAEGTVLSDVVVQTRASASAIGRASVVTSPTFWYVFLWLLPLGLIRLNRLPRPWVLASICSALTALALGVYRDIGGNVARPLFDVMGPLLSLSAAMFLAETSRRQASAGLNKTFESD